MSDHVDFSSGYLSFGFCREIGKLHNIDTPDSIVILIHKYNVKYIILASGFNESGVLGIGKERNLQQSGTWRRMKHLEVRLPSIHNIFVNCMALFVMDATNDVYASGWNEHCNLGIKHGDNEIEQLTKVCNQQQLVICSSGHENRYHSFMYFVKDDKLFANGKNQFGQFGNGQTNEETFAMLEIERFWSETSKIKKIVCTCYYSVFLMDCADLYRCGGKDNEYGCKPAMSKHGVLDVVGGQNHHLVLYQEDARVEVLGILSDAARRDGCTDLNVLNEYFKDSKMRVKHISSGSHHAAVLDDKNECFTFGSTYSGQCGSGEHGHGAYVSKPHRIELSDKECVQKVVCGSEHTLILTNNNNLYGCGYNEYGQISPAKAILDERYIYTLCLVDKHKELMLQDSQVICDVVVLTSETLIFVEPSTAL